MSSIPPSTGYRGSAVPPPATAADDTPADRIVVVGPGGAGKSSVLNCVLGRAHFHSGVRIGAALTTHTAAAPWRELELVDTPPPMTEDPVSDGVPGDTIPPALGEAANANARIAAELQRPGRVRLVFVITLEEGRVRPADVAIVSTVLAAVEASLGISLADQYALLFNKCSQPVLDAFRLRDEPALMQLLAPFHYIRHVTHCCALPLHKPSMGAADAVLPFHAPTSDFFAASPGVLVPHGATAAIEAHQFRSAADRLSRDLTDLRETLQASLQAKTRMGRPPVEDELLEEGTRGARGNAGKSSTGIVKFVLRLIWGGLGLPDLGLFFASE